jgi:large subunit ribosomal protein L25
LGPPIPGFGPASRERGASNPAGEPLAGVEIGQRRRNDGGHSMAEVKLKVTKRPGLGKGAARRSRAAGKVPGVVYGTGMDPVAIEVDRREFVAALKTDAGMNVLLGLDLDGESIVTLARELQRDPVRGTLLHADFVKLDLTQEVEVEVPVHLVGEAEGVKEGGVLEQPLFNVHVRCLPTEVPESVEADVSALNIGDSLRVADLAEGRGFAILNDPDSPVVTIAAPISEEELEAMEAAAGVTTEEPEEAVEGEPGAEEAADAEETSPAETPASEEGGSDESS